MNQLSGSVVNGRYRIINTLGIGGMSVVFHAYDLQEEREVSLKVLRADRLGDQESRRRFYNESRAIALMSHPNIVNVYDVNFEGKVQYIVMEYIDGVTLKDRMDQKGRLSPAEAIHYLKQILSALQHAHSRGVVHHDIKPQNILLLSDASVKVTDFGIASVPSFEESKNSDEAVGSVHYISPEQAQGKSTDEKTDLYSVGVMMYAMLTGCLPFDAPSSLDVARMQVEKAPYAPCKLVPELPIGFQQVIFRAMAKRPSDRYGKAAAMLADLEKLEKNPETVFPYPKEFKISSGKKSSKKGVSGFFRSLFPEDEDTYRRSRNNLFTMLSAALLSLLVVLIGIGTMVVIVSNLYKEHVNVPSYVGMTYDDIEANFDLSQHFRFEVEYIYDSVVEEGIVVDQTPVAGESVLSGSTVKIQVSKGVKLVTVPDVVNKREQEARSALNRAGLAVVVKTVPSSDNQGYVVNMSPAAGEQLTAGSTVTIFVSEMETVADTLMIQCVGYQIDVIRAKLTALGITTIITKEEYSEAPVGEVIKQSVMTGVKISKSAQVELTVSIGPEPVVSDPEPPDSETSDSEFPEEGPSEDVGVE